MFNLSLIHPKMTVKVLVKGVTMDGETLNEIRGVNGSSDPMWWVDVVYPSGSRFTELFYEKDLIKWNYLTTSPWNMSPKCTCGAETCKSPGHAYHCDLYQGDK